MNTTFTPPSSKILLATVEPSFLRWANGNTPHKREA